jgi:hypothetical protein
MREGEKGATYFKLNHIVNYWVQFNTSVREEENPADQAGLSYADTSPFAAAVFFVFIDMVV